MNNDPERRGAAPAPRDPLDLDSLEAETFRSRFDDGLLDLLAGLALLGMGLTIGTEAAGMAGVWAALVFPMWLVLRRRLVEPRTGYVEFSSARRRQLRTTHLVLLVVSSSTLLLGVGVFLAADRDPAGLDLLQRLGPIPFSIALALPAAAGALLLGVRRWWVHAGLVVGLVTAGHLLGLAFRLTLSTAGALVLLTGLVVFVRFLRDHPVPRLDGHGAS